MNKLKVFITKFLILIILLLIVVISSKDNKNKEWIKNNLMTNNFSFQRFNNFYSKYFGSIIPFDLLKNVEPVFNEKLEYKDINIYKDGISLKVDSNYLVPNLYEGVVVFVGGKDGYGNTVIVESDNVTIWYSNIDSSAKLYDKLKQGEYLGEVTTDKLILVFKRDGKVIDYKDYI